jgi:Tetratricopeptide repeat
MPCGDVGAARPLFERALIIRENALGPEHPETALILDNLVRLLLQVPDISGAQPLAERALAIKEKTLGPDDLGIAVSLHNLGSLCKSRGDLPGLGFFMRALWKCI